jgi:hypothetical protein
VAGPLGTPITLTGTLVKYTHQADPNDPRDLDDPLAGQGRPYYQGQSVDEAFSTAALFDEASINPAWRALDPIERNEATVDEIATLIFGSGHNTSFTLDNQDQFLDQIGLFHTSDFNPAQKAAFTDAGLAAGIGYRLQQSYVAAGRTLGSYQIDYTRTGDRNNGTVTLVRSRVGG